jgi:hypothetical protein
MSAHEAKSRIEPGTADGTGAGTNGTGINALTLASQRTSNFIDCADASHLVIHYAATRSAYTALLFDIDWYDTDKGSPTAFGALGVSSVASSGGYCLATLEPERYSRTVSASENKNFVVPTRARFCKVKVTGTGGGASDLITLSCELIKE